MADAAALRQTLMARALRALARREHTRAELAHKLASPSRWADPGGAARQAHAVADTLAAADAPASAALSPDASDAAALGALIQAVLDDLQARGWLSEARVVESVINTRAARLGWRRLRAQLQQRGVSEDALQAAATQVRESELARAQALWTRRFGRAPGTPRERAAQARFMLARGFEMATLRAVWASTGDAGDEADWADLSPPDLTD